MAEETKRVTVAVDETKLREATKKAAARSKLLMTKCRIKPEDMSRRVSI